MSEKARLLNERFYNQDFVEGYKMKLLLLSKEKAIVSMPTNNAMWTSVGIANGMTLGPVANAAGVFLAMMNCEYFTPLLECKNLKFYRPTKKDQDKCLIAEANVSGRKWEDFRGLGRQQVIVILVSIKGADGKERARGIFEYMLPNRKIY